ncbi:hypothetical protein ACFO1V_14970 [Daeguia caeni]|uniref:Uncharacterized protein n=1 Tax=Daeguia caeni TaxID=439612 RepID=A0ABV9H7Z7_9HYPH
MVADMKNKAHYVETHDEQVLRGVSFSDIDPAAKDLTTIRLQPKFQPASLAEKK